MGPTEEQRRLLATDRWAWLVDVLDRWYADPLRAEDGAGPEELAAAAGRIGRDLPEILAEWFTLVGRRLRPVQDAPATPGELRARDGGIVVWTENQGVWELLLAPDGHCVLDEQEYFHFPPVPLPTAVHAMVLSDTLVGAWAGTPTGPLGPLAPAVRGGTVEDAGVEDDLTRAYGELPVPGNPFWGVPPRGDAETVLRGLSPDDSATEWMTASPAAFARLDRLVPMDPPGGEHEVVLSFEGLTAAGRAGLVDGRGAPQVARFAAVVGDLGHLGMGAASPAGVRFHVTTFAPEDVVAALRSAVPADLTGHAVIAVRPARLAEYTVVLPAGRGRWVPPD